MRERVGYISNPERWGLILSFIDPTSDDPLSVQFNERYISGFRTREGARWRVDNVDMEGQATLVSLNYDEYFQERGRIVLGDEIAIIFDSSFVATREGPDHDWIVARMD